MFHTLFHVPILILSQNMQKSNISKLLFRCTIFDDLDIDLHVRIFSFIWLCFLTDVLFLMHILAFFLLFFICPSK